ncbi:MAG: cell division protein FtsL [bacterium]|nr:cell division protein FtsL [bacterium]
MTTTLDRRSRISRRGTANARFLRARNRAVRPPGPYRPGHNPRPSKDGGLGNFWITVFLLMLLFILGQIWKSHQITTLFTHLDSLRNNQQELEERQIALQSRFQEVSSYPRIEPLARNLLGMTPPDKSPVVIAALDDQFLAMRQAREGNPPEGKR